MTTNKKIKPYTPVRYTDLEYRLFNLFSTKDIAFKMPVGKETVSVKLGFDGIDSPCKTDPEAHLAFEIANELWQLSFQKTRFLYELFEMADESGFFAESPVESLPEDVLWAVLEAFLAEGLGKTEALLEVPVKVTAPVNPSDVKCFCIRFEVSFKDDNDEIKNLFGFLLIPLTDSCVERCEDVFSTFPPRLLEQKALSELTKTLFFEIGRLKLKALELTTMEAGDVLIPDIWYPKENKVALRIGTDLFFCEYDEQIMAMTVQTKSSVRDESIDELPINNQTDKLGKEDMTQENEASEHEEDILKDAHSLDLNLVFEVGETTMTIGKIGQLAKGQVIQLPHKFAAGLPVNIKVNNQLIAQGKIVGVGDDFGVQITKTGSQ